MMEIPGDRHGLAAGVLRVGCRSQKHPRFGLADAVALVAAKEQENVAAL